MSIELEKEAVDIGIVVSDRQAALTFYRDVLRLQLEHEVPLVDGGVLYRLGCGKSVFKLMSPGSADFTLPKRSLRAPVEDSKALVQRCLEEPGVRYITITLKNLEPIYQACVAAGCVVVFPLKLARPGTMVTVVEDPEGNWLELVEYVDPAAAMADRQRKSVPQGEERSDAASEG